MKKSTELNDIEAILKVSGIAIYLPLGLKDKICHSVAIDITNYYSSLVQQAKGEMAREIFEEIERNRFAEPQYIPEAGRDPVIITLTEDDLQEFKSRFLEEEQ